MSKRCDGCRYYYSGATVFRVRADGMSGYDPSGQCRIGPPTSNEGLDKPRWPLVWADEACGCHTKPDGGEDSGTVTLTPEPDERTSEATLADLLDQLDPENIGPLPTNHV